MKNKLLLLVVVCVGALLCIFTLPHSNQTADQSPSSTQQENNPVRQEYDVAKQDNLPVEESIGELPILEADIIEDTEQIAPNNTVSHSSQSDPKEYSLEETIPQESHSSEPEETVGSATEDTELPLLP